MGQSVCSTGSAVIPYSSGTFTYTAVVPTTSADDPGGILWWLVPDGCIMPANATLNPSDAAISLCVMEAVCAASVKVTQSLLTETSTTHIDSPATSPSAVAVNTGSPTAGASVPAQGGGGGGNSGSSGSSGSNSGQGTGQGAGGGGQGNGGNSNSASPAGSPQGDVLVTSTIPPPVVIGTSTYSATTEAGGSSVYIIGGQTLTVGSTITIGSGTAATTIALVTSSGNTEVVVNGHTETLPPPKTITTSQGIGNAIISGIGGTSATGAPVFTGDAKRWMPTELFLVLMHIALLLC